MTVSADTLRELHRIHQQLRDLRDRLTRGPKQIEARETNVKRVAEKLEAIQEEAKSARVVADQKELQLKSAEAKIEELKAKLNACKSNREYQALQEQIAADEMACSVLSDEILEAFEKADEMKTKVGPAEEELAKVKADLQETKQKVNSQRDNIEGDIGRLEKELVEAENRLPPDVHEAYDRVVKNKGSDSLAPVENMACTGCYQQLTPNNYNNLRLSKAVFCKTCGRLLYLPEDRTPE